MRIDDLRQKIREIDSELALLSNKSVLSRGESERWDRTVRQRDKVQAELSKLEERAAARDEIHAKHSRGELREIPGASPVGGSVAYDRAAINEAQAAALRSIERSAAELSSAQLDRVDALVRSSTPGDRSHFARWVEVHGRSEYASAFHKIAMTGDAAQASLMMDDSERAALHDSFQLRAEERAQSEGAPGGGGYAIPVFIDPSIILTNQESGNPFLTIGRTVDINTNAWKGVSSQGVSWSFDSEAQEVSDDSLTSLAQPTVTVFAARGFVPFSIEVSEDWPGFQSEMARVLMAGYDELLADKFARGSGSGEPKGILTSAAAATPTTIVTSMTDGAFGQEDVYAVWAALPAKFRRPTSCAWVMNVDIMNRIRQFGSATNWHAVTVQLPALAIDRLMEKNVYESPYFPVFSSTTGASNRLVVGASENFVIARRTGMTVELVPHLFATANNLPSGSRGFFAYARIGAAAVDDHAFRLLANT